MTSNAIAPTSTDEISIQASPDAAAHAEIGLPAPDADTRALARRKRRRAGRAGLLLLAILAASFAWYPLSDHHAPYASGGSITADVTQIAARVSGPVVEVAIRDNAEVKAGDTLFRIDDTTYRMDVELAKAQLDTVLTSLNSSIAAIPGAEAKLEQARIAQQTATDDLVRARALSEKQLLAPSKLAQAEAAKNNADLSVQAAELEIERLRTSIGSIDETNPNVRTARANLEKAEFALANTTVVAPADGYVTNLTLSQGQFVSAGTPALTFINPATQMIIADFRENQLINVEPGDPVLISFEAAPGKRFTGTVDSVAWGINAGRASANGLAQPTSDTRWFPPARKIPVRISIDNKSDLPANIRLGSEAGVLVLPEDGPIPTLAKAMMRFSGIVSAMN